MDSNRGRHKELFFTLSLFFIRPVDREKRCTLEGWVLNFPIFPVFIHEYLPNGRRLKSGLFAIKSAVKFWTRIIYSVIYTALSGLGFNIDLPQNRTTWLGDHLLRPKNPKSVVKCWSYGALHTYRQTDKVTWVVFSAYAIISFALPAHNKYI